MKREEKQQIAALPSQYRLMGAWHYFFLTILYSIPLIGLIMLIIHACNNSNICRRSFARSYFVGFIIVIGLIVALSVFGVSATLFQSIADFFKGLWNKGGNGTEVTSSVMVALKNLL